MTEKELAYIAGFLDGDGCIILQLVFRHDYPLGYQIRSSIVFYQKTINKYFLIWLKSKLKYGYIRDRNDDVTEYTVVGFEHVEKILKLLQPFLKLKRKQARLTLEVINQTPKKKRKRYTARTLLEQAKKVDKFLKLNYSKKRKRTSLEVEEYLKSRKLLSP